MYGSEIVDKARTEAFELWKNVGESNYQIHVEMPEFTALCPRSGYPDFGTIVIDYIPDKSVIELKTLKLYINSFRTVGISHEAVVNEIYRKIKAEADPISLRVIGDFMRRGGVKTVITMGDNCFPLYSANLL